MDEKQYQIHELDKRVGRIENWQNGHDLHALVNNVDRIRIFVEGDNTLAQPGAATQLAALVTAYQETRVQLKTVIWMVRGLIFITSVGMALRVGAISDVLGSLIEGFAQ